MEKPIQMESIRGGYLSIITKITKRMKKEGLGKKERFNF